MYFFIIIFKRNSWNRLFEVPFPVIQKKKIPSCKLPHKKSIQANFLICDTKINSSRNILWGLNPWGYGSIQKPYILFIGIRFSFQISLSLSVSSFLWVFLDIKKEVYSSHIEFLWAPAILINSLMFYMMFEFWEVISEPRWVRQRGWGPAIPSGPGWPPPGDGGRAYSASLPTAQPLS